MSDAARRPRSPRRRLGLLLLVGAVSGAGGVVASLASTNASPSLGAATRAAFPVFNGAGVRPSASAAAAAAYGFRPAGDLDPASMRVAQANAKFEIIVAGSSKSICLMGRELGADGGRPIASGGGCGPTTRDVNGPRLMCGTLPSPPRGAGMVLLDCLVPQGVSNLRIGTPEGPIAAEIINNTVGAIVHHPTNVSWIAPHGTPQRERISQ